MICPREPSFACPDDPCPGPGDPGVCSHLRRISGWRSLPAEVQSERIRDPARGIDPAVRDAVHACPDRGPVLPVSEQDDCGCRGREVSLCRAGRGAKPGRVTLRDCLDCREAFVGVGEERLTPP